MSVVFISSENLTYPGVFKVSRSLHFPFRNEDFENKACIVKTLRLPVSRSGLKAGSDPALRSRAFPLWFLLVLLKLFLAIELFAFPSLFLSLLGSHV